MKNKLSGAAASAAAIAELTGETIKTYGDPNPLLSVLWRTSVLVFITSWRPYMDGMTTIAADVAVTAGLVEALRLPCVAGDPDRYLPYWPY